MENEMDADTLIMRGIAERLLTQHRVPLESVTWHMQGDSLVMSFPWGGSQKTFAFARMVILLVARYDDPDTVANVERALADLLAGRIEK